MSEVFERKGYHIERLSKKNFEALDKLHNVVYRRPYPPGYFAKKYDTSYTGVEYIGYLAYNENGNPIAYYGVIPCFIRYQDQLILAAQSADAMTHPKYQFKGLFVQLANLTLDLCAEEGISLVFGFPNQTSLHTFLVRLKWQMTESMDCYIVPVSTISTEKMIRKLPFIGRKFKQYQQKILDKYLVQQKGIENSVFKDGFGGVNRNALYMNYKTYHDSYVIRIDKALLWIRIKNNLIIGDMDCQQEDFDEVMRKLKKLAFRLGLAEIHFHTCHQTRLSTLFAERYEAVPSYYVMFKSLGSHIPLDRLKFTFADQDIF